MILDVKMPGADGLQAARDIRDLDLKVAVLILTAFSQRNLIDEARDAGVAAYLVKPFQRIELIPAIDQAMARCEQEWAIDAEARQAVDDGLVGQQSMAEDKLETRRLVDGAKGVLMERTAWPRPTPSPSSRRRPWGRGPGWSTWPARCSRARSSPRPSGPPRWPTPRPDPPGRTDR